MLGGCATRRTASFIWFHFTLKPILTSFLNITAKNVGTGTEAEWELKRTRKMKSAKPNIYRNPLRALLSVPADTVVTAGEAAGEVTAGRSDAGEWSTDQSCIVCFGDYYPGDLLCRLPCRHVYHAKVNKPERNEPKKYRQTNRDTNLVTERRHEKPPHKIDSTVGRGYSVPTVSSRTGFSHFFCYEQALVHVLW